MAKGTTGKRDQRHFGELKDGTPDNTEGKPDQDDASPEQDRDAFWLRKASGGYEYTSDWMSSGVRKKWEDNISRFNSTHPPSSKFNTEGYKKRNKHYRPKTRSNARRLEARAAAALFSNYDVVDTRAQNRNSEEGAAKARLGKELLQYRMEHSIPWFLTCLGSLQNTFNYGITFSRQGWSYEEQEDVSYIPVMDPDTDDYLRDEDDNILGEEIREIRVVDDRPEIHMIAPENFRFDPNCDWRDPVGTSPILIELIPMYAYEVAERGKDEDPNKRWREYTLGEIVAAGGQEKEETEAVRNAREGRERTDSRDTAPKINEFEPVWVHLNTCKYEGRDYSWFTLGTTKMLSDPVPTEELIPLGRDAYTMGISVIEAHKNYPAGGNELGAGMQEAINSISNQRFDNVELVLNKRYFVRRNSGLDLKAMARNVPGGSVFTGDPENDVRIIETPDVTGSSYQEQDRAAVEMDELTGNFSGSSVQSNRALNETVGGMAMMQGDATSISDYEIRTFVETWVEPVLRKTYKLIAMFETDETIIQIASENAELMDKYGIDNVTDEFIDRELVVSVNVGMGNTDPIQRVQKLGMGLQTLAAVPDTAIRLKGEEIGNEVFGSLGFGEGRRFLKSDEELADEADAMNAMGGGEPPDTSLEVANIKATVDREKIAADKEVGMAKVASDRELGMMKLALEERITLTDLRERLGLEERKRQDARDFKAVESMQKRRDQDQKDSEMTLRRETGAGV